jgi:hypothetical protein
VAGQQLKISSMKKGGGSGKPGGKKTAAVLEVRSRLQGKVKIKENAS